MEFNLYQSSQWSNTRKIFFYFFFVFVTLYAFPFPIDFFISILQRFLTFSYEISNWEWINTINEALNAIVNSWTKLWEWFIPKFGDTILRLETPATPFANGSGDTTYDYVNLFVKLIFSCVGCIIWYFFGKNKTNHFKLYTFLITGIRYYLAFMLLNYGFIKVIQLQFSYPNLMRLTEPYGQSSPMGLAWTFMGYSYGYNVFTGSCEIIAGLFLFFRRTKTFGAIMATLVFMNIFVMNLCFDIPVKLFSGTLLAFSIFIASDDFYRLLHFFFKNKAIAPYQSPSYFENHKWEKQFVWIKYMAIAFMLYTNTADSIQGYYEYGKGKPKAPLRGIYNLESKMVNQDTVPLIYGDTTTIKQIIVDYKDYARVKLLNDSLKSYIFNVDSLKHQIELYPYNDTLIKHKYKYTFKDKVLTLRGKFKKDSVHMTFKQYDENKFLLHKRGFHWVNEYPMNR